MIAVYSGHLYHAINFNLLPFSYFRFRKKFSLKKVSFCSAKKKGKEDGVQLNWKWFQFFFVFVSSPLQIESWEFTFYCNDCRVCFSYNFFLISLKVWWVYLRVLDVHHHPMSQCTELIHTWKMLLYALEFNAKLNFRIVSISTSTQPLVHDFTQNHSIFVNKIYFHSLYEIN